MAGIQVDNPIIKLPIPIVYGRTRFDQIPMRGYPFKGFESTYYKFRAAVGLDHLAEGNPNVVLDTPTYTQLLAESLAYSFRASGYFGDKKFMNPIASIQELDKVKAIFGLIKNQTDNEYLKSLMDQQLVATSIVSNIIMAEVALQTKNFAWANQLWSQSLETVSVPGQEKTYFIFQFPNSNPIPLDFQDPEGVGWPKYLSEVLRSVRKIENSVSQPHNNLLPDPTFHPESLQHKIDNAIASGRYMDDIEASKRVEAINGRLYGSLANPFINHVGLELLSKMTEGDLGLHVDEDYLRLETMIGEDESRTVVEVRGNMIGPEKVFEISDEDLQARVLHLVHSDPYVVKFGRFNTRLVLVPVEKIPD